MELMYGILAALGLGIILGFFQSRKKKQSWVGTVTKIKYLPSYYDSNDNPVEARHLVHYRTDTGKKGKVNITEHQYGQLFSGLKVGDRLNKQAGRYLPQIVRQDAL
ncbi:MAG: hypothetical protein KAH24_04010 [Holophagae bacterium]|nr:hypothetical protein [Holophagae bacterium]